MSLLLLFNAAAGASALGTFSATLNGVSLTSSGNAESLGTLAVVLDGVSLAASGNSEIVGSLAATLEGASLAACDAQPLSVFVGIPRKRKPLPALGFVAARLEGASLEANGTASHPVFAPIPGAAAIALEGISLAVRGEISWSDDDADALAFILALAA